VNPPLPPFPRQIPLCRPSLGEEELQAVKEVLDSGWLAHGPKNKEFEAAFSAYVGTPSAACFNSCASALIAAIKGAKFQGEIILPSFTFSASANAIVLAGCTPVFAEINPTTFNLDPEDIEHRITKRTVAIMPVHYAGQICEMDKIMAIAKKHNLRVIEDSAETLGASLNGKQAGSFDIGCFSFYPTKNITTGEGGMVTFHDPSFGETLGAVKAHGVVKPTFEREKITKSWYRDAVLPGFNFRMSDINAAIGLVQLKKVNQLNAKRQEHAQYLNQHLTRVAGQHLEVPHVDDIKTHVYQMYVIKVKDHLKRDALMEYLKTKGIQASVHFEPPVHLQSYYAERYPARLPLTEQVCKQVITLPMFPDLKQEELDYMVEVIADFFDHDSWIRCTF